MHVRLTTLTIALIVSPAVWAATSNVNMYGTLPAYPDSGIYSAATSIDANLFTGEISTLQSSTTTTPGEITSIGGVTQDELLDLIFGIAPINPAAYVSASASTLLGSNHAYSQARGFSNGTLSVNSFSGWYDQVTVTGGTGIGTLQFSVHLTGSVTAGAYLGAAGFSLAASSVHPEQLATDMLTFNTLTTQPWGLYGSQVQSISTYNIVASPYNDPNVIAGLFSAPAGGGGGMGFPELTTDLIVTPGDEHLVDITLTGTLDFTYGEAFYLIGALGSSILGDGLESFCSFDISGDPCVPVPKDGTGATTLDFLDSALLTGIVLPEGASFTSASGAAYNVTAVPEPGEWAMLLAGLGLVAWRTHRKTI